MGMVVRTNTMALNAYRQLGMNNSAVAKSLEKLSSGFRINRAGDDAAGLAISEKMKAQITGLETASANAQDGISLIQTAEGNLTEVHSMLNRMVELASKSANGTYTSQERSALQAEVDSLLEEIDRISKSANFNGTKLLDGTMGMSDAVQVVSQTKATKAGESSLADKVTFEKLTATDNHFNTGSTAAATAPTFKIDLADIEATMTDAADAGDASSILASLSIDGNALTFYGTAANAAKASTTFTDKTLAKVDAANTDKDTETTIGGDDIAGALNNTYVNIGGTIYSVAKAGDTGLTFTYHGVVEGTGAAATVTDDSTAKANLDKVTWVPKGDVNVSFSVVKKADGAATTAATITDTSNRQNCHITAIKDTVASNDVKRGGATLDLSAVEIKSGMTLKIGETEFTFDDTKTISAAAGGTGADVATGNTIGIKGITNKNELLKAVTAQLSHLTAKIKDANGTEKTFTIGRGSSTGKIEIEENVQTDSANYGKFTQDQLKAAFKLGTDATNAETQIKLTKQPVAGSTVKIGDKSYVFVDELLTGNMAPKNQTQVVIGDTVKDTLSALKDAIGSTATLNTDGDVLTITGSSDPKDAAPMVGGGGLTLQIGDTAEAFNKMTVEVKNMGPGGLGIDKLDITSEAAASNAIDKIKTAINTVSTARAGMGALQNRLEHTINNLDVAVENLSAANSRIRDTDMAKEMMNYTKMNVLVQSAQAMLAQANQQPQSVLQLLQ